MQRILPVLKSLENKIKDYTFCKEKSGNISGCPISRAYIATPARQPVTYLTAGLHTLLGVLSPDTTHCCVLLTNMGVRPGC